LFGVRSGEQPKAEVLRYQLMTAVAGSLAYAIAEGVNTAVLVIHQFRTSKTDDARHHVNASDLDKFLCRLGGAPIKSDVLAETLEFAGPFNVPGRPLFDNPPPLLIGKIVTNRRALK
jgi:hypothetical protein